MEHLDAEAGTTEVDDDEKMLPGLEDYTSDDGNSDSDSDSDDYDSDASDYESDWDEHEDQHMYFEKKDFIQRFTFAWPADSDGFVNITAEIIETLPPDSQTISSQPAPSAGGASPPESNPPPISRPGKEREAPFQPIAECALKDLKALLCPSRKKGRGYIDPDINRFIRTRMEGMQTMLNFYINKDSKTYDAWNASAFQAAISLGHGRHCARQLRILNRQFIKDRTLLPINPYGSWNESMLVDEDLTNDISLYLLEIGKEISAKKLMEFLAREDIRSKHGIEKPISEQTARRYLNNLGYRWSTPKKGQYADGHEREDVVYYQDQVFLPQWHQIEHRMPNYTQENLEEFGPRMPGLEVIVWFHDESIFYAHDRRKRGWYHKDAPAKPYAKGEGASLMVADFVSAKFGWLRSPDGTRSARVVMKPGKNKDGYFTSDEICKQAEDAMMILREFYPQYEHVLIYDNASTHLKRAPDALSARRMPKNIPKPGGNWGVEVTKRDPVTGKIEYKPDGTPAKVKTRMADARFADGSPQSLYFPNDHERGGVFKGMSVILQERGFGDTSKVRAECKDFKCVPGATTCCCRRILYFQPDFANVESLLETTCKARGVKVIFLPKFHCELNFIEQCWGYAKRIYRLNPESSREDVLEKNALNSLESIPLASMRKFANRSRRFMDAYCRGLNGRQAAWVSRRYRGHRVLPEGIMAELEKANIV